MQSIGKLLPIEGYQVKIKQIPTADYTLSLTHFYQPLIGMEAIILYLTLYNETQIQRESTVQTHHALMNYLNVSLDSIYKARLKLEGIGLLKTYRHQLETTNVYTYELQRPFSPKEFLHDDMLSQLLFHQLGDEKYSLLKKQFDPTHQKHQGINITAAFYDVFETVQPSVEVDRLENVESREKQTSNIDFTWLEMTLKQRMIPPYRVLTGRNKKVIINMKYLYGLAKHDIEKALLWALTETNELDVEEFKEACFDLYKQYYQDKPVQLHLKQEKRVEQQQHTTKEETPPSKSDEFIKYLESMTPIELLEEFAAGAQATEQEIKIISDIMANQGLPGPVMNVLIHYVLIQSDMKFSKAYVETIASHWSRLKVETAQQAMELVRKEQEKYKQRQLRKNERSRSKPMKKEVVPEWFKERNAKQKDKRSNDKRQIDEPTSEKEREALAALIQQFAND